MAIETEGFCDPPIGLPDSRLHWQGHIREAITDLRNSDRSPFEQQVYDALRVFADQHLKD